MYTYRIYTWCNGILMILEVKIPVLKTLLFTTEMGVGQRLEPRRGQRPTPRAGRGRLPARAAADSPRGRRPTPRAGSGRLPRAGSGRLPTQWEQFFMVSVYDSKAATVLESHDIEMRSLFYKATFGKASFHFKKILFSKASFS